MTPAISVLTISILIAFTDYFILKGAHLSNKKLLGFCFFQLIFTILLGVVTFFITKSENEKSDNILATGYLNTQIGKRTEELASQIKTLSNINDSIVRHSDSLASKIDVLTKGSGKLINNIDRRAFAESEENALTGRFKFDVGKPLHGTDTLTVHFGALTAVNTILPDPKIWYKAGMHLITFQDGFEPITFGLKNHKLVISVDVYDLSGNLIVKIDSNFWHRYTNNTGIFNYDKAGFEVFDNRGNIALSINLTAKKISIQGYLIERKYNFIMIAGDEKIVPGRWGDPRTEAILIDEVNKVKVKQLFRYTGLNWLHHRI